MKILLTGSTGYVGRRLLPVLVNDGHHVVCLVRDTRRFDWHDFDEAFLENITVVEGDLLHPSSLASVPRDIDAAYYLIHSLHNRGEFADAEKESAKNFANLIDNSQAKQIIYLGGIANDTALSEHLNSRKAVESVLGNSKAELTVLRAAIIIGSGSASFEIIRDLVEKLLVMVAPRWLNSLCQPIGIRNVIEYLTGVLGNTAAFGGTFDIGGPDILSYKEILLGFARSRRLKRTIITLPVLTPRLSSIWLNIVTTTSYPLARNLVDSMINNVIVKKGDIDTIVLIEKTPYTEALKLAFGKINQKNIVSSWTDALGNRAMPTNFMDYIDVPGFGCFTDKRRVPFARESLADVKANLWQIGGQRGWYFGNWLWKMRGFFDKILGGVGLRRGRRNPTELKAGDALDFWRVILADEPGNRLLLYAEMKLPGEAWLDFRIQPEGNGYALVQTATFRPLGLAGRIYWYLLLPFHTVLFPRMAEKIVRERKDQKFSANWKT